MRKQGYQEINKLLINNPKYMTNLIESEQNLRQVIIKNQEKIREETRKEFAKIYREKKENKGNEEDILEFLDMGKDTAPKIE